MALWDDLVAYYKCRDGSDSWGKYSVSLNNVTISEGIGPDFSSWDFTAGTGVKAAVVEDIDIPNDTNIFSISMWFKKLHTGNVTGVVTDAGINWAPIRIADSPDELGIKRGDGFHGCGYEVAPIQDLDAWTHLVVTCADSAGTYLFYINGNFVGTTGLVGALVGSAFSKIGNLETTDKEFADYISDVAFWSRAITSDEVELIYSNGASGTRDLARLIRPPGQYLPDDKAVTWWADMSSNVLLYHFIEDDGANIWPDSSGEGYNGAGSNVTEIVDGNPLHSASYATGTAGSVLTASAGFNGSTSYVDTGVDAVTLGVGGNNNRTILFWASASSWSSDNVIFTMGDNTGHRHDFTVLSWTTHRLKINTWYDDYYVQLPTTPEQWNHYAFTYNSSSGDLNTFYNGSIIDTHTFGSVLDTKGTEDIRIGGENYEWGKWPGRIQEFAIFTGTLGPGYIKSIYEMQDSFNTSSFAPTEGSASVADVFATVVHEGGSAVALDNVFATVVHEGGSAVALDNVFATVVHEGGSAVALDNVFATVVHTTSSLLTVPDIGGIVGETASFTTAGSYGIDYYHWYWDSVPAGATGIVSGAFAFPDNQGTTPINMSGNTALYHCDGPFGGGANDDSSGNGNTVSFNNMTLNAPPYIGTGSWGYGIASSNVTTGGGLDCTGDYTIAFWLYNLAASTDWRTAVKNDDGSYPILVEDGSDRLGFKDAGGSFKDSGAELTASDGWHHIASVGDKSKDTMTYWVDGVKEGTVFNFNASGDIESIGNKILGGERFADRIDEFAFWTRALSDQEVQRIYFLQNQSGYAASGNFGPTLSFVPEEPGTYVIKVEVSHRSPPVTGTAEAIILPAVSPEALIAYNALETSLRAGHSEISYNAVEASLRAGHSEVAYNAIEVSLLGPLWVGLYTNIAEVAWIEDPGSHFVPPVAPLLLNLYSNITEVAWIWDPGSIPGPSPGPPPIIPQEKGVPIISRDFSINTFAIGGLSRQRASRVAQVPFKLGVINTNLPLRRIGPSGSVGPIAAELYLYSNIAEVAWMGAPPAPPPLATDGLRLYSNVAEVAWALND
jgi:hypothetical protein